MRQEPRTARVSVEVAVNPVEQLKSEQRAFEAQLASMLPEHAGQFVLFHGGQPVEYFTDEAEGYQEGVRRFGRDIFLLTPVAPPQTRNISIAWRAGVMFGR